MSIYRALSSSETSLIRSRSATSNGRRRFWRSVLYDEIVMRKQGEAAPWGNLKEAYQILKEKYRQMGDHATSGDFHYGEMEAKRREYGWPKRILCPEFLYWAFSGYESVI